jgi:exodeoxyribonuclease-5
MEWSAQQAAALKAVSAWRKDRKSKQVFRLFGYAGTGKTTLAKEIAEAIDGEVLFGAFTGKASLVLRGKGCENASTLHSLCYKPVENEETGEVTYVLNPDSPLLTARLLIVDEVSMVGPDLGRDLESFGCKILVLGDPFQLPPVNGEGYFTAQNPDVLLTEIHRQAADNPIIRMSMDIREGRGLQLGTYGDSHVVTRADLSAEELREIVLASDQVLVGMNKTRRSFNARIRALKGFQTDMPEPGDRLVCLKNNRLKGLLNGSLWRVDGQPSIRLPSIKMDVKSLDDPKMQIPVEVSTRREFFRGEEKTIDWRVRKALDEFDFGEAITVHKAQGSQFDNVTLFDESAVFREHADRHAYTGITRAAERVTVVI